MSDLLSQDEIDALLHGVDEVEEDVEESEYPLPPSNTTFRHKTESYVVACPLWKW